jgi:hypothetical protein
MNNNRLSTNPNNQRELIIPQTEIDAVFSLSAGALTQRVGRAPPYEVRNGARYLSGTNKLVPELFPVLVIHPDGSSTTYASLSQCALDLGISRHPVQKTNLDKVFLIRASYFPRLFRSPAHNWIFFSLLFFPSIFSYGFFCLRDSRPSRNNFPDCCSFPSDQLASDPSPPRRLRSRYTLLASNAVLNG